mmetsp:Transcript_45373/g.33155  ORF Transcript_45373/g.33155 Transcript_45373/m.33155 type:complete len:375 (-) Transcript_45373:140-1264(-)
MCSEVEERPFEHNFEKDATPFFIVERGDCSFVKKVRNLEAHGVALVIIIDNTEEDFDRLVLQDDGTGGGIQIPSMMISKSDGQMLLDYMRRASADELGKIVVMAEFEMSHPDNRVEYDVFYSSAQDKALDFFYDFALSDSELGDQVLMTPRLVYWQCASCDEEFKKENCICDGRYCALDARDYTEEEKKKINGREIVLENLREKCIYKLAYEDLKSPIAYWAYMKLVHRSCYRTINYECFTTAVQRLKLPFALINECVDESFSTGNIDSYQTINYLIDEDLEYVKKYGTGVYPQISINKVKFRGNLDSLNVFNAICAGFESPPKICIDTAGLVTAEGLKQLGEAQEPGVHGGWLFLAIVGIILLNLVVIYCYRR